MTKVVVSSAIEDGPQWVQILSDARPKWQCRLYNSPDDVEATWLNAATYLVTAGPTPGLLQHLTNLQAIHSIWAGIEHITKQPDYDGKTPIIRMVDEEMTRGMVEYVVGSVLYYHTNRHAFAHSQGQNHWKKQPMRMAYERQVGILGLGVLGTAVAKALKRFDFKVAGWSRAQKQIDGVTSFHGKAGLAALLAQSDILVCLLPRTPETEDILDAQSLEKLPDGACLINAARGEHIVADALLNALDRGKLAHATLDVFRNEPLPATCPFWAHPKITVTPHIASNPRITSCAKTVMKNLDHLVAGKPLHSLPGVVNLTAGY